MLPPGSTLGILGGGQLGRMLAMAAARLGLRVAVYDPAEAPPAAQVASETHRGGWDDAAALARFAAACDVVTYEFENVPAASLDAVEAAAPLRPSRRALAVSQDRLDEKTFLQGLGLTVAPFAAVDDAESLSAALDRIGTPAILKTRRLGYDGKGQARLAGPGDAAAALDAMAGAPAILEGHVAFAREISVIAARGTDGTVVAFEPGENLHEGGILRTTTVPAAIPPATAEAAERIACTILDALDYTGVLGVELFDTDAGLVVNEIAPRVHNSGHWTEAGATLSQFDLHVRAVMGWPLPRPRTLAPSVMENLIGDDVDRVATIAGEADAVLHLYGKAEVRAGRKMGHVTRVGRPPA